MPARSLPMRGSVIALLDRDAHVPISCPHCGGQFQQTLGGIVDNPSFECPFCGTPFVTHEISAGLREINEELYDS